MLWLPDVTVEGTCFIIDGNKFWIMLLRRVGIAFVGCIKSERICERACVVVKERTCGLVGCEWGLMF
jgi:hypothetical protein